MSTIVYIPENMDMELFVKHYDEDLTPKTSISQVLAKRIAPGRFLFREMLHEGAEVSLEPNEQEDETILSGNELDEIIFLEETWKSLARFSSLLLASQGP